MAQLIVDVSEHNGDIDWQQVKDAGYHAIIRAGFGRFSEGGRVDYKWERNVSECERLGIPYGVYWYSYASSPNGARQEGADCMATIGARRPAYPVYFDTEQPGTQGVSYENAIAFNTEVEHAGFWAGVYASQSWWNDNLQGLERYTKWVAKWSNYEPDVADTDLWQYRGADADDYALRGSVPGIGWSDVNVLLRENMLSEIGIWGDSSIPGTDVPVCPECGQPLPQQPPAEEVPDIPVEDVQPDPQPGRLTYPQMAAEVMLHMVRHDGNGGHGYSQYARWGDGTTEQITLSDGTVIQIPNGDFDCSSSIVTAWEAVYPGSTGSATYTGDYIEGFTETGLWEWVPWSEDRASRVGEPLLNIVNHTAMVVDDEWNLAQFSISELGTVYGQQGDQTGWESNIKPFYNYPWDGHLAWVGPERDGSREPVPAPVPDPAPQGIEVDGYWGPATTSALQRAFGTEEDGEVWHQWQANVDANPGLTGGWVCDATLKGSPLIRAIQSSLGVATDGIMGSQTVSALQSAFGHPVDGYFGEGSPTIKAIQEHLNAGDIRSFI